MDLIRIAARVAAVPTAPPGGADLASSVKAAVGQAAASLGKGGQFPIGNGVELFADNAELDESAWWVSWSGDDSEPMALMAQHKHDVDVLLEFTHQEAAAGTAVAMAVQAVQEDAAVGAS